MANSANLNLAQRPLLSLDSSTFLSNYNTELVCICRKSQIAAGWCGSTAFPRRWVENVLIIRSLKFYFCFFFTAHFVRKIVVVKSQTWFTSEHVAKFGLLTFGDHWPPGERSGNDHDKMHVAISAVCVPSSPILRNVGMGARRIFLPGGGAIISFFSPRPQNTGATVRPHLWCVGDTALAARPRTRAIQNRGANFQSASRQRATVSGISCRWPARSASSTVSKYQPPSGAAHQTVYCWQSCLSGCRSSSLERSARDRRLIVITADCPPSIKN